MDASAFAVNIATDISIHPPFVAAIGQLQTQAPPREGRTLPASLEGSRERRLSLAPPSLSFGSAHPIAVLMPTLDILVVAEKVRLHKYWIVRWATEAHQ